MTDDKKPKSPKRTFAQRAAELRADGEKALSRAREREKKAEDALLVATAARETAERELASLNAPVDPVLAEAVQQTVGAASAHANHAHRTIGKSH